MSNIDKNFQPIRMLDLNRKKTHLSASASARRLLNIQLSDLPPNRLVEFFAEERQFPRDPEPGFLFGRVWIEGDCVIVDCAPTELASHLDEIKVSLNRANAAYRNFLIKKSFDQEQIPDQQEIEQADLEKIRASLNFN